MKRLDIILLLVPPLAAGILFLLDLWPAVGAVLLTFWLFVSLSVGVLRVLDWFRRESPGRPFAAVVRHLMRVPIILLGVTATLIGTAVLAWFAYNIFWERQPEFSPWGSVELWSS